MLASWAYSYGATDAAAALGISTRPRVIPLDEMWRALRAGTGMVDSFDALTRLNRQKGSVTIMVTHSLAAAAMADKVLLLTNSGLKLTEIPRRNAQLA